MTDEERAMLEWLAAEAAFIAQVYQRKLVELQAVYAWEMQKEEQGEIVQDG